MAYANEQVQDMFNAASDAGYSMTVTSDGIVDYRGDDTADALDAVLAVEEAHVQFFDAYGSNVGWAMVLPDLDEGEQIADCSGWVSIWLDD